jgi:hypothetical protein
MSTSSSLSETQLWSFRFLQVAYLQDMITNANRRGILCWTLLLQCVMISGRCLGLMYLLQPHMQRFVTWKVIGMTIKAPDGTFQLISHSLVVSITMWHNSDGNSSMFSHVRQHVVSAAHLACYVLDKAYLPEVRRLLQPHMHSDRRA